MPFSYASCGTAGETVCWKVCCCQPSQVAAGVFFTFKTTGSSVLILKLVFLMTERGRDCGCIVCSVDTCCGIEIVIMLFQ